MHLHSFHRACLLTAYALLCLNLQAQNQANKELIIGDEQVALFQEDLRAMTLAHKGNPDMFVRNGVVADRKNRTVRILALCSGVAQKSPLEYLLVWKIGKVYESMTATLAKPTDVTEALQFIGMIPGHPIRQRVFYLWSKGDEVNLHFSWKEGDKEFSYPAQELILENGKAPVVNSKWIYTGSYSVDIKGRTIFAADDTGDIISTFNSPWTLIDVGGKAVQGEFYGNVVRSPKFTAKMGTPIEITISPALPPGESNIVDLVLKLEPAEEGQTAVADDLIMTLSDVRGGKDRVQKGGFRDVLKAILPDTQSGKSVFVRFDIDQRLPISALSEFFAGLREVTSRGLLKIDPTEGELFYEAFVPQRAWADPNQRPGQPIEIILPAKEGDKRKLRYFEQHYLADGSVKLKKFEYRFSTAEGLKKALKMRDDWMTSNALFFAPKSTTYGELMTWYKLLCDQFPVAYVFCGLPPKVEKQEKKDK